MRKSKGNKGIILVMQVIMASMLLAGCGQDAGRAQSDSSLADRVAGETEYSAEGEESQAIGEAEGNGAGENTAGANTAGNAGTEGAGVENTEAGEEVSAAELLVSFGDNGDAFTMHLYENDTAQAVAGHVGTSDWRLPIYNFDNYEGWEYFQYYDIPNRYEIPSNPETITVAKAGEVYYSEPNRIILFYHDAEISEEYTPIGYIDSDEAFVEALENNPVLEGWGNKIVRISDSQ